MLAYYCFNQIRKIHISHIVMFTCVKVIVKIKFSFNIVYVLKYKINYKTKFCQSKANPK